MSATRARSAAAAARLLAGVDLKSPVVTRFLDRFAQWVTDYFGYASAAMIFAQGEQIFVAATSRGSVIPAGIILPGDMLYAGGVLGCGASVVLSDSATYDTKLATAGIRLLVAVPLLSEDVPIGALCLLGREPHRVDAEDLLILQQMGRNAAMELAHLAHYSEPPGQHFGFAPPNLFDAMVAAELSILHREGGGAELVLVDTDSAGLRTELGLDILARSGARSGVSRRGNGTVAIFKRDPDQATANRIMGEAFSLVSSATKVQATGWVSVDDRGLPLVPQQLLLQIARLALDQARSSGTPETERIVIAAKDGPG
jgi:hypothetical protein